MNTIQHTLTSQANLIQPLKLQVNLHSLRALNSIWNYADMWREDIGGFNKSAPSILVNLANKLTTKQQSKALQLWPIRKTFKISLQPYEAVYLEHFIRGIIYHMPYGFERNVAERISDEINQKLA